MTIFLQKLRSQILLALYLAKFFLFARRFQSLDAQSLAALVRQYAGLQSQVDAAPA